MFKANDSGDHDDDDDDDDDDGGDDDDHCKIESYHDDEGDDCHYYGSCQSIRLHTIVLLLLI